eukprot:1668116-Rhodomonas_salina.1
MRFFSDNNGAKIVKNVGVGTEKGSPSTMDVSMQSTPRTRSRTVTIERGGRPAAYPAARPSSGAIAQLFAQL